MSNGLIFFLILIGAGWIWNSSIGVNGDFGACMIVLGVGIWILSAVLTKMKDRRSF